MIGEEIDRRDEAAALFAELPPEFQQRTLQAMRRMAQRDRWSGSFGALIGIQYSADEPGRLSCSIDVDESLYNPGGVAHGGVVYSLIDSVMGGSVYAALPPGQRCVTAELKVNYLRPILAGRITATATIMQQGRSLAVVTAEVYNADQQLVAIGLGTFAILRRR